MTLSNCPPTEIADIVDYSERFVRGCNFKPDYWNVLRKCRLESLGRSLNLVAKSKYPPILANPHVER